MTHHGEPAAGALSAPNPAMRVAIQAVFDVRGHPDRLLRVFERTPVPMVVVDDGRRHLDGNRPARLVLRLSKMELLRHRIDDLTPSDGLGALRTAWRRLLDVGWVTGRHDVAGRDGSRFAVVYWAVLNMHPGRHLITFTPADWPAHELGGLPSPDGAPGTGVLTPREREVLQLAAEGLSGPDIADVLVISHATVRTHFHHIYEKLDVGDRSAAVASALRRGLID